MQKTLRNSSAAKGQRRNCLEKDFRNQPKRTVGNSSIRQERNQPIRTPAPPARQVPHAGRPESPREKSAGKAHRPSCLGHNLSTHSRTPTIHHLGNFCLTANRENFSQTREGCVTKKCSTWNNHTNPHWIGRESGQKRGLCFPTCFAWFGSQTSQNDRKVLRRKARRKGD